MPCSAAIATTSSTGCSVPTSLLAHITETRATEPGSRSIDVAQRVDVEPAARRRRAAARPRRRRRSASQSSGSRTAWCSTAVDEDPGRGAGRSARRAQKMPLSARLSDSVPPEVNTTSPGRQSSAWAIVSRDSSTTRRACRPEACSELALPTVGQVRGHRLDGRRAASASSRRGRGRRCGSVIGIPSVRRAERTASGRAASSRRGPASAASATAWSARSQPAYGVAQPGLRGRVEQRPGDARGRRRPWAGPAAPCRAARSRGAGSGPVVGHPGHVLERHDVVRVALAGPQPVAVRA